MESDNIKYTVNQSSLYDIEQHLLECDKDYFIPLSKRLDIHKYAVKIKNNAIVFEAWCENKLIGLIACYANNPAGNVAFITNVSVTSDYRKKGIAQSLFNLLFEHNDIKLFPTIEIQVFKKDDSTIYFYNKNGFIEKTIDVDQITMTYSNNKTEPLVSICCLAYNHEHYIRECLDGFMMQKTNFPFEILIHDDASTDKTADIIREYEAKYPEIIKPIYQTENQYSKGVKISTSFQFSRAQGKYIALCEGDDYWTNPLKLQKQVDFLEKNTDYVICFHNVVIKQEVENIFVDDYITKEVKETTDIYDLAKGNYIHTPSIVFRSKYIKTLPNELSKSPVGDYILNMYVTQFGKIKKLNDRMAVYRVHNSGVWSTKNKTTSILIYLNLLIKYFSYRDKRVVKILKDRKKKIIGANNLKVRLSKIVNKITNNFFP